MVKLTDICNPKQWKTIPTSELKSEGYPVYGANGIIGYYNSYNHEKPTIAITCRGATCGTVNLACPKSYITGNAMCLDEVGESVDLKYLYYAMKAYDFSKVISGTAQPQITREGLQKVEIAMQPIENQRTIVRKLDTVDSILVKRKQQLAKLDELVKSRFIELFGDPVENPYGWEKVALADLADIRIGPFGSLLHKEDYVTNGHPLVNPSHIMDGKITPDFNLTVAEDKYAELSPYHLIAGDVVMGRRGEMGRCAVVDEQGLLCGTGSLIIRTKGDVTADYLQKIISFPSFKRTIEDMAVGQTMPNLNVPLVSGFRIIKPPLEVQEQYYALVEQTDKSKLAVQKSLENLEILKKSLMQQYFG